MGVILSVNLFRSVFDFLGLKDRLTEAEERVAELQKEQGELEKEYSYKTSAFFLEREIREKLNMAKPGEIVVMVPLEELKEASGEAKPLPEVKIAPEPAWKQWVELIF